MRVFAIASYYLVIALFGVGIGPVLIPWIASFMAAGPGTFTRAMAIMGGLSGLVSLALCALAMIGLRHRIGAPASGTVSAEDVAAGLAGARAEERLVWKECVITCRSRLSPCHSTKKTKTLISVK